VRLGDEDSNAFSLPFYASQRVLAMIGLDKLWGVNLIRGFPCVVTIGVSFPFDQILKSPGSSMTSVAEDALHHIFCLAFDKVRWRTGEVWTIGNCLMIGR
jgi:hypothetical protein